MHHHHHTMDASEPASVMLDIGGDVGALIFYVPASEHGHEIEVSRDGTDDPRTHAAVRERRLDDRSLYCVVYPSLPAGVYTVWVTPPVPATVVGGEVAEVSWSGDPREHAHVPGV